MSELFTTRKYLRIQFEFDFVHSHMIKDLNPEIFFSDESWTHLTKAFWNCQLLASFQSHIVLWLQRKLLLSVQQSMDLIYEYFQEKSIFVVSFLEGKY